MKAVNLLPESILRLRARARRIRNWSVIAGVYATLLTGGYFAAVASDQGPAAALSQLEEASGRVQTKKTELTKVKEDLLRAERALAAAREVAANPDWSIILRLLAQKRGEDITIQAVSLAPVMPIAPVASAAGAKKSQPDTSLRKPVGYTLRIDGLARRQRDLTEFVLELEHTGIFAKVVIVDSKAKDAASAVSEGVNYIVQCDLEESGKGKP